MYFEVLHAVITWKVSDKLTIGGRFKMYSSALNLESTNNTGTFTTNSLGSNYLDDVSVNFKSSGMVTDVAEFNNNPEDYLNRKIALLGDNAMKYLKRTLFGGNTGKGLDFGFTYNVTPQLQVSGSVLDVGFIHHKKNIKNTSVKGSYLNEGIVMATNDVVSELELREQLSITHNQESYISWRPAKLNTALKYSFGYVRSEYCYDHSYKSFYTDAFGAQLYAVYRPLRPQFAFTGFYEKSFSKEFHAKITYTLDDYSYYNVGVGVSAQIWKFNFYGIVDNIAEFYDISSANNVSLQIGFNLLFN